MQDLHGLEKPDAGCTADARQRTLSLRLSESRCVIVLGFVCLWVYSRLPPASLGRELLAQLSTPASQNFSDAISASVLTAAAIQTSGDFYIQLLQDIDTLVATDAAFLLGPWIAMARQWGINSSDCSDNDWAIQSCPDFYEWNARTQLVCMLLSQPYCIPQSGCVSVPLAPSLQVSPHTGLNLFSAFFYLLFSLFLLLGLDDLEPYPQERQFHPKWSHRLW